MTIPTVFRHVTAVLQVVDIALTVELLAATGAAAAGDLYHYGYGTYSSPNHRQRLLCTGTLQAWPYCLGWWCM